MSPLPLHVSFAHLSTLFINRYFCEPHESSMTGIINVVSADILLTQSGESDWAISSNVDGVVNVSQSTWPEIRVTQGQTIKFVGTVTATHSFAVKAVDVPNTAADTNVVGPSAVGPAVYELFWTAGTPGKYEYYCPPHSTAMRGALTVVSADNDGCRASMRNNVCLRLRRGFRKVYKAP